MWKEKQCALRKRYQTLQQHRNIKVIVIVVILHYKTSPLFAVQAAAAAIGCRADARSSNDFGCSGFGGADSLL